MALSRLKIRDIITISDERNSNGENYPFYGINIFKEFMPSVANTQNVDKSKYKIVKHKRFVFSGMQTGRDNCIRISMYAEHNPILVSPAYTTFEVTNSNVLPEYFFMIFQSKEMDRYGAFLSDSSVRANLDWDRFCNIELEIPSLEIQRKYVAIYESMLANLRSYEKGLDDLKLVCEGYIEKLQSTTNKSYLGDLIVRVSRKNINNKNVMGVCSDSVFTKTKANISNVDLSTYSLVKKGDFAYNPSRINLGSIALCDEECIVSPMYEVFSIKDSEILDCGYLHLLLTRKEFLRSTSFFAIGSVRDTFDFDLLSKTKIPLPNIDVQKRVVAIYEQIKLRKSILAQIKNLMNNLIPVLIRGSIANYQGGR